MALYTRIDEEVRALREKDPRLRFLGRLRYHALSLAGSHIRVGKAKVEARQLATSAPEFKKFWDEFWPLAKDVLIDMYAAAQEAEVTLFALLRSVDRWHGMKNRFDLKAAAR